MALEKIEVGDVLRWNGVNRSEYGVVREREDGYRYLEMENKKKIPLKAVLDSVSLTIVAHQKQ